MDLPLTTVNAHTDLELAYYLLLIVIILGTEIQPFVLGA